MQPRFSFVSLPLTLAVLRVGTALLVVDAADAARPLAHSVQSGQPVCDPQL